VLAFNVDMHTTLCVSLLPTLADMSIVRIHARPCTWNVERGIFILFKQEQKQKPKQIQKKTQNNIKLKRFLPQKNQLNKQPRKLNQ
jgi:hypothetical protein